MGKNNGGGLAGHSGSDAVWRGRRLTDRRGSAAGGVGPGSGSGRLFFSTAVLGVLALLEAGSEEQRSKVLTGVSSGQTKISLAVTEARYGWKKALTRTKAERREGGFALDGVKLFVQDAGDADLLVCTAVLEDGEVGLFLVDPRCPACLFGPLGDS